jgi:hypothetical protein
MVQPKEELPVRISLEAQKLEAKDYLEKVRNGLL